MTHFCCIINLLRQLSDLNRVLLGVMVIDDTGLCIRPNFIVHLCVELNSASYLMEKMCY
jgi:hypothetical protein